MRSSDSITAIAAALVKAQAEMGNASKGSSNPFFRTKYADLNAVREAVIPVLNKHGITAIQPTTLLDGKPYVETVLLHESGEWISSYTEVVCNKPNDAQSHGSGVTYARRYGLQSIINIGAEDDDGNAATSKAEPKSETKKAIGLPSPTKAQYDAIKKRMEGGENIINSVLKTYTLSDAQAKELAEIHGKNTEGNTGK